MGSKYRPPYPQLERNSTGLHPWKKEKCTSTISTALVTIDGFGSQEPDSSSVPCMGFNSDSAAVWTFMLHQKGTTQGKHSACQYNERKWCFYNIVT